MTRHKLATVVITDCTSPEDFVRKYHTHAAIPFDLEAMTKPGNSYRADFDTYGICWVDPHGSSLRSWTIWCPSGRDIAEETIQKHKGDIGYLLPLEG